MSTFAAARARFGRRLSRPELCLCGLDLLRYHSESVRYAPTVLGRHYSQKNQTFHEKMSKYKLSYFDMRGVGESIRFIFAATGVPYENERLPYEEFVEVKAKRRMGFGQMPILEIDGTRQMTQSLAIGRYLGKKFGLFPSDEFLAAKCDEVVDFLTEIRLEFKQVYLEEDATKKNAMSTEFRRTIAPKYYAILSELIDEAKGGPFICGEELVWGDCFVANWVEIFEEHELGEAFTYKYPVLKGLKDAVYAVPGIKRHIEERPNTLI